jgi:hypothetical protein
MLMDSQSAQSEESASPRKPNVRTVVRSSKLESLDVWCLSAEGSSSDRDHLISTYTLTDALIVLRRDPAPIVDDFDGAQPVLLKAHFCTTALHKLALSKTYVRYVPILVAPASRLFSTSSLTAVCRSMTTWPDVMRCTLAVSIALMLELCAGSGPGISMPTRESTTRGRAKRGEDERD